MSPGPDERDWDKELAKIDKLIAAGGGAAPAAPSEQTPRRLVGGSAQPAAAPPTAGRRAVLFTWARVALGITAGVAMTQWPYTAGCGVPLFAYLGGVAAVTALGISSIVSSWRTRSSFAHFLSVGLLFWGSFLAAREVLPRVGYARDSAAWLCEVGPAPGTTPAPPQAAPATPPTTTQPQESL